jgi:virginiamycin B lyase
MRHFGLLTSVLIALGSVAGTHQQLAAQTINEFPLPTGSYNPGHITVGPDGALWFTHQSGVGQITAGGVITEFQVPFAVGNVNSYITAGPDGALWFTDGSTKIGRITTAGVFTNAYPVPTANSGPLAITAGPDEALWFTEHGGDNIGRITTDGVTTHPSAAV